MLSKENRNKLSESRLYQREIPGGEKTWCRNGTYRVRTSENAEKTVFMVDTFYMDHSIELTDKNFNDFNFVMDYNEVINISYDSYREYSNKDRFNFAVDSGGWQYSKYFSLKTANKNTDKRISILKDEIKSSEYFLEQRKKELKKLQDV